jgi:hypothetical protein
MTMLIARPPAAAPPALPAAYTAAAKGKLKRDRDSYAAFRKADQDEWDRAHADRLGLAVTEAEENLHLWREEIAEQEPRAEAALAAFRAAEDRHRQAAEFARTARVTYESGKGKVSPAEETDLLIRADTADQVSVDAAEVMTARQADLADVDASLAEAREGLAAGEPQLDKARSAAEVPAGQAPVSDTTIRACSTYMQADELWNTLSRQDKVRVVRLAEPRPALTMHEALTMGADLLWARS